MVNDGDVIIATYIFVAFAMFHPTGCYFSHMGFSYDGLFFFQKWS